MLVLNMESKRQRRPNVRLGEIGDASAAAFACGISQKFKKELWGKRWEYDFISPQISEYNHFSGFSERRSSEFTVSDPDVSPRSVVDRQHNRENKNPNSMKGFSEIGTLYEVDIMKSRVGIGTIAQKCGLVIKGRRSKRCKRRVFNGPFGFERNPKVSTEVGKKYLEKEVIGFASNSSLNLSDTYGFNGTDSPDNGNSAMSKQDWENEKLEPTFKPRTGDSREILKKCASLQGNNLLTESFTRGEYMEVCHSDFSSVARWLEELGFGIYAGVFKMHEVDEEALPLLTFDDLKEMGVFAIGTRQKLYSAIQQLRNSRGGYRFEESSDA